jgi:ribosomal protein S1
VELKVLEVNPTAEKISLGLKQTLPDPYSQFKEGSTVEGKVKRLTDHGAFVEIAPDIEAFLHVSEISSDRRLESPSEVLKEGDDVTATVVKVQKKPRKIDISIRKHDQQEERRLLKQYRPNSEGVSLAEVIGWKPKAEPPAEGGGPKDS